MSLPDDDDFSDDGLNESDNKIDSADNITEHESTTEDVDTCDRDASGQQENATLPNVDGGAEFKLSKVDNGPSGTPFKRRYLEAEDVATPASNRPPINSPFYKGPTTFGGNSANSHILSKRSPNYTLAFPPPPSSLDESNSNSAVESRTSRRIREILERHEEHLGNQMRGPQFCPYERPCGKSNSNTSNETNRFIQNMEKMLEGRRRLRKITLKSRKLLQSPTKHMSLLPTRQVQNKANNVAPNAGGTIQNPFNPRLSQQFQDGVPLPRLKFPQMANAPSFNFDLNPVPSLVYKSSGIKQRRIFIFSTPLPLPPAEERPRRIFTFEPPIGLEEEYIASTSTIIIPQNNGDGSGFDIQLEESTNAIPSETLSCITPNLDAKFQQLVADQNSNKWNCDNCLTFNDKTQLRCVCCSNLKIDQKNRTKSSDSDE